MIQDFGASGLLLETNGSNLVAGCRIGTNTAGSAALGNSVNGIVVTSTSTGDTIGGTTSTYRNLVSGNGVDGIVVGASTTVVEGNLIGTNLSGTASLANGSFGVLVLGGTGLVVGGSISSCRNIISSTIPSKIAGVGIAGGAGTLVQANWIGPTLAGTGTILQADGVEILTGAGSTTIGGTTSGTRNVINSCLDGILVQAAGGITIQGNWIGLDTTGALAIQNRNYGIWVDASASPLIGGSVAGAGNVISGSAWNGIVVRNATATIRGNLIGLDAGGTTSKPNLWAAINLQGAYNVVIGGFTAAERNVLSGNGDSTGDLSPGVYLDAATDGTTIVGNYIGTNAAGTGAVGNYGGGIISVGSTALHIGSQTAGGGNLISGNNGNGVKFDGTPASLPWLYGNVIGLNAAGTAALGNQGNGVLLSNMYGMTVGGCCSGMKNVISGNAMTGVLIQGDSGNNRIYGNYIGTDPTGTVRLGNNSWGIAIDASTNYGPSTGANTIGGNATSLANVIAGQQGGQIHILGPGGGGNLIYGNLIGTNAAGTASLTGNGHGIDIEDSRSDSVGAGSAGYGNLISGNGTGIYVQGGMGTDIQGNLIGTNLAGTGAIANTAGISLSGTSAVTVGGTVAGQRNVISGNSGWGMTLNTVSNSTIEANLIGLAPSGTSVLANGSGGIYGVGCSAVTIGGTSSVTRNVIAGNLGPGVKLAGGSQNSVLGNYIGLEPDGGTSAGNSGAGSHGIWLTGTAGSNTIGGTSAGARNFVTSSGGDGVRIEGMGGGASSNVVAGNTIGLNSTNQAAGNSGVGVRLVDAQNNTIGGTAAGSANVIAASGSHGVSIESTSFSSSGNTVLGNRIGTDSGETLARGNTGSGVNIVGTSSSWNSIGWPGGGGNVIANNLGSGVRHTGGANNSIRANSIFSNGGGSASILGIDLGTAGPTPNDHCDGDSGPNNLQNFPAITAVTPSGAGSLVSGTLDSTASSDFLVDVYSNVTISASGYGEGQAWLGSTLVSTNGSCAAVWSLTTATPADNVTATASDYWNGSTSEFSPAYATGLPTEAGGAAQPLKATKGAGTAVSVTYGSACNAAQTAVYWGTSPISGSVSWQASACSVAGSFDPGSVAAGQFVYFVVVGEGASAEGSYGRDSAGNQIPAKPAGCHTQSLSGVCP